MVWLGSGQARGMTGLPPPPTVRPSAPPTPSAGSGVRIASRTSGIDRVWGSAVGAIVVLIAAMIGGVLLLTASVDTSAPLLMLVPALIFSLVMLAVMVRTWRSLRAITIPIELDHAGLVLRAPQGDLRCPWEAVAGIGFGRIGFTRTLVVRLHPQAGPGAPGIETTLPPRVWRIIRRHGLRYAAWLLDIDTPGLAEAIGRTSGGRVQLMPSI